jgi:hypothetical protein
LKAGTYRYEWLHPATGENRETGRVTAPGGAQRFQASFASDAVLWLERVNVPE